MSEPQGQKITPITAWSMLRHIPANDRETWLQIGMALHSEFGQDGFAFFDEWSRSASNYNAKDVLAVWRSFKGGSITIASLVHHAKAYGWTPPPKESQAKPQSSTKQYAIELWLRADCRDTAVGSHPYPVKKGIKWAAGAGRSIATGKLIGKDADCIIVPIRNIETQKIQGVQCINTQGQKQTFGHVSGGCLLLGNTLNKKVVWYVAEGWASAVSVVFHHQAGNGVCAASFGKGTMRSVAEKLAEVHGPDEIVILREVDA